MSGATGRTTGRAAGQLMGTAARIRADSSAAALAAGMVLLAALVLTGCAPGANDAATVPPDELAGFWLGLWQGFISPITFLVSLFNAEVNIYEVHNDGNWYNFGFMLGVAIAFGGPASAGGYATPGRNKG